MTLLRGKQVAGVPSQTTREASAAEPVPALTRQEEDTFVVLSFGFSTEHGGRESKVTLVLVLFANGVLAHTLRCLVTQKLTIGQDSAHFTVHAE